MWGFKKLLRNFFHLLRNEYRKFWYITGTCRTTNYLWKYSTTPVCAITRETGSNTKVRKYLFSRITVFRISHSVKYTSTRDVIKCIYKIGGKNKITDALFNQQIREKRCHYRPLHLAVEGRYWRYGRARTSMILKEEGCGSWWLLSLDWVNG